MMPGVVLFGSRNLLVKRVLFGGVDADVGSIPLSAHMRVPSCCRWSTTQLGGSVRCVGGAPQCQVAVIPNLLHVHHL